MNFSRFYIEIDSNFAWRLTLLFISIFVILSNTEIALATSTSTSSTSSSTSTTTDNAIEDALCQVISILSGGIARSIATIAIFFLGIGLFLGKVNWGVALVTAIAIAVIFGASNLVTLIVPDSSSYSCATTNS